MAVRSTMAAIIANVRDLIGDAGTVQFTDQHIQDVLDGKCRFDVRYEQLEAVETIYPGGTVKYLDFKRPAGSPGDMEGTAVILDGAWGTITPTTADYSRGWFTWAGSATPPYGPQPPVRASYASFSSEAAGAVLCDQWAGSVALAVDYSDPSFRLSLSQQFANLTARAKELRTQAPARVYRVDRDDDAH